MTPSGRVLLLVALGLRAAAGFGEQAPTFHDDVQPILIRHCVRCHQAGGGAPMPLVEFDEIRPWASSIAREVEAGRMPPWFAAPDVGQFANDSRIGPDERDVLLDWVASGASRGSPGEPVRFDLVQNGWRIGTPDLVIEMPQPFAVPALGEVDYVYVRLPLPNHEDRWVRAVEVLAGVPSVIHHVDVFACPRNCRDFSDLEPGVPSFLPLAPTLEPPVQDDVGEFFGLEIELLFSYLPGGDPWVLPPELGRLLPGDGELLLNLHYTPNGQAASDRTRVGFVFQDERPTERVVTIGIDNETLWIPAGAKRHEARAEVSLARELRLLALTPHMHLRGRSFDFTAALPDGRRVPLLSVPDWNFNWQLTYVLEEPMVLPRLARLFMNAAFDNSTGNRYNPDPTRNVPWGRQVTDEMMTAWVEVAFPADADPRALLIGSEAPE